MADPAGFVVIGAGLAGAAAVETLREEGFDGRITVLGDEVHRPYERPPLSKGLLQGGAERESVFVHPEDWYAQHDVDLRLGTEVGAIDRAGHEVLTAAGERCAYDRLLIATGAAPRRLEVPGAGLEGVHYLRTLEDSERIRAGFACVRRVVMIGAGWIGLETAAAARAAGLEVVLLEGAAMPLLRVLGETVAPMFADLHERNLVDLRCGVEVLALVGAHGRVSGVRLGDGSVVGADMVVVGVGVRPRSELAAAAGLHANDGITVDAHLRTSDPDVFAAGDVANAYSPLLGRHLRVEHWANARWQGATAARSMLGHDVVHDRVPYFYSDQYDWAMEYTGHLGRANHVLVRQRRGEHGFIVFWLRDGRVLAGMNVNVWDVAEPIAALVRSGRPVDTDRLFDPDVPLEDLLGQT